MIPLAILAALAVGTLLSGRIIAAVRSAETSIHDRLRKMHDRISSLEDAVKAKL